MKSPTRKKILHLITGLEVGGAETMLLKILPQTQDTIEHHVCSIIGVGPIGDQLADAGIAVHYLDLNHNLDIAIIPRLRKLIADLEPDVLITYLPHADLLGRIIGRAAGIPTIVGSVRVRLTRSKYLPLFLIDGLTSPLVTHYHFNSQTIASIHHRLLRVASSKITVIPNAINIAKYNRSIDVAAKKKELNLPADKVIIGCVARLRRQKGHQYLIAAFDHVRRLRPDTVLVLAGDGEEKTGLVREIERRGLGQHVVMLGNRHDIPDILQTFDIFTLTTLYEGMSNSIMEAMAASRPIITTSIPENKELIEHNKTGLLVPPKNSRATAAAVTSLVDSLDKRRSLGRAAYQAVADRFSIDAIVPHYQEFYARL